MLPGQTVEVLELSSYYCFCALRWDGFKQTAHLSMLYLFIYTVFIILCPVYNIVLHCLNTHTLPYCSYCSSLTHSQFVLTFHYLKLRVLPVDKPQENYISFPFRRSVWKSFGIKVCSNVAWETWHVAELWFAFLRCGHSAVVVNHHLS